MYGPLQPNQRHTYRSLGQNRALNLAPGGVSLDSLRAYWPLDDGAAGFKNIIEPGMSGFAQNSGNFSWNQAGGAIDASVSTLMTNVDNHGAFSPIRSGTSLVQDSNLGGYAPATMTFGAWVRPDVLHQDSGTNTSYVVVKGNGGFSAFTFGLNITASASPANAFAVFARLGGGSFPAAFSTTPAAVGKTTFVVGSWSGTDTRIWVNGVREGTVSTGGANTPDGSRWGLGGFNGGNWFAGAIWNAFLFERVLTDAEVRFMYSNPWCLIDKRYDRLTGIKGVYTEPSAGGPWVKVRHGGRSHGGRVHVPPVSVHYYSVDCSVDNVVFLSGAATATLPPPAAKHVGREIVIGSEDGTTCFAVVANSGQILTPAGLVSTVLVPGYTALRFVCSTDKWRQIP